MGIDVLKGAKAAGAATGLSAREIFYLVERSHIPARRVGRSLFFSRRALLAALGAHHASGPLTDNRSLEAPIGEIIA